MNSREYQVECPHCEEGSVYVPAPRFTKALEFEYHEQEWDCAECWGEGFLWEECIGHMLPYVTKYKTYTECDCVECEEKKGNTK